METDCALLSAMFRFRGQGAKEQRNEHEHMLFVLWAKPGAGPGAAW